jgi:hypothetical protein
VAGCDSFSIGLSANVEKLGAHKSPKHPQEHNNQRANAPMNDEEYRDFSPSDASTEISDG